MVGCLLAGVFTTGTGALAEDAEFERWRDVPMPHGLRIENTELDGPVFANVQGHTLYIWPLHKQRNGYSGELPGTPACKDALKAAVVVKNARQQGSAP